MLIWFSQYHLTHFTHYGSGGLQLVDKWTGGCERRACTLTSELNVKLIGEEDKCCCPVIRAVSLHTEIFISSDFYSWEGGSGELTEFVS